MSVPGRRCQLGVPGPMRDRLISPVLNGDKTATSSLLSDWEAEGESLPRAGERQAVVDSADMAVAVIEIVSVDIIRLGDADLRLASDEGEGFASVPEWRAAHEAFWATAVDETRASRVGRRWALEDDTKVVVERFRFVARLPG